MLEIVIAVIGSVIAGAWDLKTTEVPDEIPVLMVSLGIFLWFITALNGNSAPFVLSSVAGTIVLALGLLLYKHGKWGGADAWIFAAVLYLIPVYNSRIFVLDYIPNLVWVSALYTVIYAVALGIMNKRVLRNFVDDVKDNAAAVIGLPAAAFAGFALFAYSLGVAYSARSSLLIIFVLMILLALFWRYARVIENKVFTRRIPTKQLKPGDVLQEMIWRGLTPDEVAKIKKSKKFVTIKEGMRFVPVFPIALIVTLLYGNLMFWFL